MSAEVRAARLSEYPLVRDLIAASFTASGTQDEADIWDYLVENDSALRPEGVRLAVVDGRPVACTIALPRRVRGRTGWLPGAVITLVCCHPDFRLQGHGGSTVRDAMAWVTAQGGAVSILYGVPRFYPRFGFAPVLPRLETTLPAEAVSDRAGRLDAFDALVPLDPTPGGLATVGRLFDETLARYPLAVAREQQLWQWRFRNARPRGILVLRGGDGYAVATPETKSETLIVYEAAADGVAAARHLLSGLAGEARGAGLARIRLLEPAGHLMTRIALACGAEQVYRPAASGMAFVNSWPLVLPDGYGTAPEGLLHGGRLVLRCPHAAKVQLALGYRSIDELLLVPECEIADDTPGGGGAERLHRDFPRLSPRWHEAPYWW